MDGLDDADILEIGPALDPLRAAIDVVAIGAATRVTVHVPNARRLFAAAAQLGKRAGVRVELVDPANFEAELTVRPIAASGR